MKSPQTLQSLKSTLTRRRNAIRKALRDADSKCLDQQGHLIKGTVERDYWHCGYMIALSDILNMLVRKRQPG